MGRHTERAAAMRRHPAGKRLSFDTLPEKRLGFTADQDGTVEFWNRRTGATVIPFHRATISATATADTITEKEPENV